MADQNHFLTECEKILWQKTFFDNNLDKEIDLQLGIIVSWKKKLENGNLD